MSARSIALKTAFSSVLAANIIGNTIVLVVLSKNKWLLKPEMRYLVVNLAIADMMVGIGFAPNFLLMPMSAHPTGMAGNFLCKFVTGKNLAWLASLTSAFTLILVAIERYYAVVHPLRVKRKLTKRKIARLILCSWVLATLISLPSFLADRFDEQYNSCTEKLPRPWQNVVYNIFWTVAAGVVPIISMTALYVIIFRSLSLRSRSGFGSRVSMKAKKMITKMMFFVSLFYILCCFPTHILYFVYIFHPKLFPDEDLFFPISYILLILNSSINPLVYGFQSKRFKDCCKEMFCRGVCRGDPPNGPTAAKTNSVRQKQFALGSTRQTTAL